MSSNNISLKDKRQDNLIDEDTFYYFSNIIQLGHNQCNRIVDEVEEEKLSLDRVWEMYAIFDAIQLKIESMRGGF